MPTNLGTYIYGAGGASANPSVGANGATAPTSSTEIAGVNPSGNQQPLQTTADGALITVNDPNSEQHVIVDSSALPAGASTSALQTTGNTSLSSIDGKTPALQSGNVPVQLPASQITALTPPTTVTANQGTAGASAWKVDGSGVTQPISATALPLPTGASTSALQATGNTSLNSIDSKTPALGQALAAVSVPVVLPASQITALTPPTTVTTKTLDSVPAAQNITVVDTGSTSTVYFNNQTWYSGTPTTGSVASFSCPSIESGMVQISGTWTGTLQSEISVDNGVTWLAHSIHQIGSANFASSFTANFVGSLNLGAKTNFRVRATAAMTGTAVINVIESLNPSTIYVANAIKVVDASGTNIGTVKASSVAPVATDTALVVAISPNSPTLNTKQGARALANAPVYNVYSSTNITTTAYVQLVASTSAAITYLDIFDSSGQAMILATGASGSEVIQYYIPPGGDQISIAIAAGTRIAYKALTASATSGYLLVNMYA